MSKLKNKLRRVAAALLILFVAPLTYVAATAIRLLGRDMRAT